MGRQQGARTCHCAAPEVSRPSYARATFPSFILPMQQPGQGTCTHLPTWAATAKLAGFLHTDSTRLQVGAEVWTRGGTGAEHPARGALCSGCTGSEVSEPRAGCLGPPSPRLAQGLGWAPTAQDAHRDRAADHMPAIAPCPAPGMVSLQDAPGSSDGASLCPHHRELSRCSRLTMAPTLDTVGVRSSGTH